VITFRQRYTRFQFQFQFLSVFFLIKNKNLEAVSVLNRTKSAHNSSIYNCIGKIISQIETWTLDKMKRSTKSTTFLSAIYNEKRLHEHNNLDWKQKIFINIICMLNNDKNLVKSAQQVYSYTVSSHFCQPYLSNSECVNDKMYLFICKVYAS
jgi:hypothetical protein